MDLEPYYTLIVGEGNGNTLHYSCLENPRDGGAWWAAVYGVTRSRTRLRHLSSSSRTRLIHADEQRKLNRYCKAIVNQSKRNKYSFLKKNLPAVKETQETQV